MRNLALLIAGHIRMLGAAILAVFTIGIQTALAAGLDPHQATIAQAQREVEGGAMAALDEGAGTDRIKPYNGETSMAYVRWSELEIDLEQLDTFKTLAEENVCETRRTEPGVIAFYWASEKDHPDRIRVLEIYADTNAYQKHLQSSHFQRFRAGSAQMVINRGLFEAIPVMLGAKPQSPPPAAFVRIAELEIDPARLDAYKAAVREEIDDSIHRERGVFAIYALALKDRPNHLRFFEIYADESACQLHRETPHFMKYLGATQAMITARRLIETVPASRRNSVD